MMELKILKYVNHPRVIKFIDFFETVSDCNIIMEYACNGSLRNLIMDYQQNHYKLSHRDLIDMFLDIAFGVKYLHIHKIIHRDLKPENVLMVENFRIKIGECDLVASIFKIRHVYSGFRRFKDCRWLESKLPYIDWDFELYEPWGLFASTVRQQLRYLGIGDNFLWNGHDEISLHTSCKLIYIRVAYNKI